MNLLKTLSVQLFLVILSLAIFGKFGSIALISSYPAIFLSILLVSFRVNKTSSMKIILAETIVIPLGFISLWLVLHKFPETLLEVQGLLLVLIWSIPSVLVYSLLNYLWYRNPPLQHKKLFFTGITVVILGIIFFKSNPNSSVSVLTPEEIQLNEITMALIENEIVLCKINNNTLCLHPLTERVNIFSNNEIDHPKTKQMTDVCFAKFYECRNNKIRSVSPKEILSVYDLDQATTYFTQREAWSEFVKSKKPQVLEVSDEKLLMKYKELKELSLSK